MLLLIKALRTRQMHYFVDCTFIFYVLFYFFLVWGGPPSSTSSCISIFVLFILFCFCVYGCVTP